VSDVGVNPSGTGTKTLVEAETPTKGTGVAKPRAEKGTTVEASVAVI